MCTTFASVYISDLFALYPDIQEDMQYKMEMDPARFLAIKNKKFQSQKSMVLMCRELFLWFDLPAYDRKMLLESLEINDVKTAEAILQAQPNVDATTLSTKWATRSSSSESMTEARKAAQRINDAAYIAKLDEIDKQEPLLATYIQTSLQHLYAHFTAQVKKIAIKLRAVVENIQKYRCKQMFSTEYRVRSMEAGRRSWAQLLEELDTVYINENACVHLSYLFIFIYPCILLDIEHSPPSLKMWRCGVTRAIVSSFSHVLYEIFPKPPSR